MRFQRLVLFPAVLLACHRPTEVRGLYLTGADSGWFFPCDDAKTVVSVQDTALVARYQHIATSNQPVFVRLRGIKGHEGSIYGGRRYFNVQQILEVRPGPVANALRLRNQSLHFYLTRSAGLHGFE